MKRFGHSGDLGDIIQFLPIVQQLGGKHGIWLYNQPFTKNIESRFHLIAPLLMQQPYVEVVGIGRPEDMDYDVAQFRKRYVPTRTLLASQADYVQRTYGLPVPSGAEKWLTVKPEKKVADRIVVARSPRYHNPLFPWKRIVEHYGNAILFVGLPEEHQDFCSKFGPVEHRATADLLETAQLIAGAALFIGNQSSPNSVAEGLKVPRIQETNLRVPDCIFPRATNAQYVANGCVTLPAVAGRNSLLIESPLTGFREMDVATTPPGGWQLPGYPTQLSFPAMVHHIARETGRSVADVQESLYMANCHRVPDFFRRTDADGMLLNYNRAVKEAAATI